MFKPLRELKRELDSLTIVQLSIVVLILGVFLVLPVSFMILRAFFYKGSLSLHYFQSLLSSGTFIKIPPELRWIELAKTPYGKILIIGRRGPNFGILLNSLFVSTMVMIFAGIIGTTAAFIMARYDFPGKNVFKVLLLIPMLATPFVNAFVLGKVLSVDGLFNYLMCDVLHVLPFRIWITGLPALILIQTLSLYPIVYLNAFSSFINIDPTLEEQAENLGARGLKLFLTITLPLALPGISAGAALVFIFSMEDLGAPIGLSGAFGGGLHEKILSFQIYDEFRRGIGSIEQVHASTYAMAVIMLLVAIVVFLAIKKYVSLRSYAMLSKGGRWKPRVRRLGIMGLIPVYIFLTTLAISASFPQIGVVILAFTNWAISGVLPTKFTTEYISALVTNREVARAITNSLIYSSIATAIMLLVGTSAAYIVARKKIPGRDLIDTLSTLPIAIPGIIVAVGYLLFFATYFSQTPFDPFFNPGLLLIFSYSVRRLPFSARTVFAGLQQVHESLEEAAMNLGASRAKVFFTIALPLIVSNVISGGILSFVYSMNEVSTSITLSNLNPSQGPITFYMSQVIYASAAVGTVSVAAALGVLLIIAQITAISISNYILKQRVAFLGV
ncbi:MAG: iron ABC transporter permease [Thermoprotei archaeon]|nr:MAG: iron ABC transporter permease [Thermoprotei archaeon]